MLGMISTAIVTKPLACFSEKFPNLISHFFLHLKPFSLISLLSHTRRVASLSSLPSNTYIISTPHFLKLWRLPEHLLQTLPSLTSNVSKASQYSWNGCVCRVWGTDHGRAWGRVKAGLPSTPHWTPAGRLQPQKAGVPLLTCIVQFYTYTLFLATFSF